jgi:hypothetical protein
MNSIAIPTFLIGKFSGNFESVWSSYDKIVDPVSFLGNVFSKNKKSFETCNKNTE